MLSRPVSPTKQMRISAALAAVLIASLIALVSTVGVQSAYAASEHTLDGEMKLQAPTEVAWDTSGESPAITFKGVDGAVKYNVMLYCDRDNGRHYTAISFSPTLYHNPSPDTAGTPYEYRDSLLKQIMDEGGAGNWTFRVEAWGDAEGTVKSDPSEPSEEYKSTVDISNNKAITITNPSSIQYHGEPIRSGIFVRFKNNVRNFFLDEGTDYTVSYKNNTNVGKATVTITGKGNYTGSVEKTFNIYPAYVYLATVTGVSNKTYNGKAQTQNPTVKVNGVTLKNGTDYTVSYKNNKNVGTATMTITGKGNYAGSKNVTFKINGVTPHVKYKVHRQTYGWEKDWKKDGQSSGTTGQSKRLEGIYINLDKGGLSGSVQYRVHVQTYGWAKKAGKPGTGWVNEGKMAGTTGESKRLEAIQIKLTGDMAKQYDIYYRVHAQKFGWMGWAKNGASAGTAGYSYRLEAIQIKLVKKGGKAPGSTANAFRQKK